MNNLLFLPGNERELVDNYLDKTLFPELAEKYGHIKENDNSDITRDIRRQAFQIAMRSFAVQLSERQCQKCEDAYWNPLCGDEAESIRSAPMPDLCSDIEAYSMMKHWWFNLTLEQKLYIVGACESLFNNSIYNMTLSDEELNSEVDNGWCELPIDDKFLIYETHKIISHALQKRENHNLRDAIRPQTETDTRTAGGNIPPLSHERH